MVSNGDCCYLGICLDSVNGNVLSVLVWIDEYSEILCIALFGAVPSVIGNDILVLLCAYLFSVSPFLFTTLFTTLDDLYRDGYPIAGIPAIFMLVISTGLLLKIRFGPCWWDTKEVTISKLSLKLFIFWMLSIVLY